MSSAAAGAIRLDQDGTSSPAPVLSLNHIPLEADPTVRVTIEGGHSFLRRKADQFVDLTHLFSEFRASNTGNDNKTWSGYSPLKRCKNLRARLFQETGVEPVDHPGSGRSQVVFCHPTIAADAGLSLLFLALLLFFPSPSALPSDLLVVAFAQRFGQRCRLRRP